MGERLTVADHLGGGEECTRKELVWGMARESPAPHCDHQIVVGRVFRMLAAHAELCGLGTALVSPVDVVLDETNALVLQPDIVFVAAARAHIVRDRVWGPPDVVVEVLSPGSRRRDTLLKRRWYQQYGVREYWIVDPFAKHVEVSTTSDRGRASSRVASGDELVKSAVLTGFSQPARTCFGP